MARILTPKEEHDELMADLEAGTHTYNGRPVLAYSEYDMPEGLTRPQTRADNDPRGAGTDIVPHPYTGKRVISIQYGGPADGDGGLLREFAFDKADLKEPEPEPETAPAATAEASDKPVVKSKAEK
jgi:hypothetical protein